VTLEEIYIHADLLSIAAAVLASRSPVGRMSLDAMIELSSKRREFIGAWFASNRTEGIDWAINRFSDRRLGITSLAGGMTVGAGGEKIKSHNGMWRGQRDAYSLASCPGSWFWKSPQSLKTSWTTKQ
jgi:hypothetical protein